MRARGCRNLMLDHSIRPRRPSATHDPECRRASATIRAVAIVIATLAATCGALADEDRQFNRDVRPILSDNCFQCHGPDSAQRKAELRLDVEASAKRDRDGSRPIVPGRLDESALYARITSTDPELRMPPPTSGKKLSAAQIDVLARWIRAGAAWERHWAFIPPQRPVPPSVQRRDWPRNPIDAFILARLEAEQLAPAPEADRTTLARRVTLDLTGLPPTPAEVDAFVTDDSADAYQRLVDRLLASPRFGEQMAARWLDAARYADTSGYQTDGPRVMWRWRDWVIEAFNHNLAFDRFTIEQLAGDLLPAATLDERIASGFNRNHRGNSEGGIIPEEYAVEYVVDRVDTTATVWLGLTVACARCHDHKFDPFSQREFYQLFAFFNNVPEKGRAIKVGNSPPFIKAPTRHQQQQLQALEAQRLAAEHALAQLEGELAAGESRWSAGFSSATPLPWAPSDHLLAQFPLNENDFDGTRTVNAGDVANFGYFDRLTLSAWIRPRADTGTIMARMAEQADAEGYSLQLAGGRLQVNLVKRWLDDAVRVETAEPLAIDRLQHVAVTYDGSRAAAGVKIFVDGRPQATRILLDELNQSFSTSEPLRLGGGGPGPAFRGLLDEVRIDKTDLPTDEIALLATRDTIDAICSLAPADRTRAQSAKLRAYYLAEHAPQPIRAARKQVLELAQQQRDLEESFPTTMVMQELPVPRESFVLVRGQYDKPGERVTAGVPASLPPLPTTSPDRLALARWLVDPAHPLTARVIVNRLWQAHFGTGLVKTVDDFGAQGDPPSHAALLDWLATELVASGWNLKALQRAIVSSATYRQSSRVTPRELERDPDNRLLARGPRFRFSAEMIRDASLAASGLLVEEFGGPSVHPYQPPGLWKELTGGGDATQDHGANLYRRSLYTFWKRTIQPPSMMTFDASGREACSVRVARTNTPLQALALMNEVTFVEAARMLAQRVMQETGPAPSERITLAFRLVLARRPSEQELRILRSSFERRLAEFREDPAAAAALLHVGEAPAAAALDACELAAYATVANLILNLDEAVTKE